VWGRARAQRCRPKHCWPRRRARTHAATDERAVAGPRKSLFCRDSNLTAMTPQPRCTHTTYILRASNVLLASPASAAAAQPYLCGSLFCASHARAWPYLTPRTTPTLPRTPSFKLARPPASRRAARVAASAAVNSPPTHPRPRPGRSRAQPSAVRACRQLCPLQPVHLIVRLYQTYLISVPVEESTNSILGDLTTFHSSIFTRYCAGGTPFGVPHQAQCDLKVTNGTCRVVEGGTPACCLEHFTVLP
jgi:hypothetical protein